MGFRLVVKLSKYFTDERSTCYVYVEETMKNINNLESYLCELFNLEGYFCLLKNNILLPSCENINILQANETISVIPLTEPFYYKRNSSRSVEETSETIEKDVKKKKRKKNKEINSGDVTNIDIDPEEKTTNKENLIASCSTDNITKHKALESYEISTAIKNIEEYYSKLYPQDDEDELESMKTKALNTLKEHFPVNISGVSDGRIKKRKRIRIRKSKKNNQIEMLHSDSESGKAQKNSSYLLSTGKKGSHIRFNPSEKPVHILQNENIVEKVDKTPRIIRAIKPNGVKNINMTPNGNKNDQTPNISDVDDFGECESTHNNSNTISTTAKTNGVLNNSNINDLKINNLLKHIDLHPSIRFADAKENNVIMFKMLKMNDDYTPVISNYILGRILNMNSNTLTATLSILDGQKECTIPSGKFNLEEVDCNSSDNTFDVTWDQVLEPRMIIP